VGVVFFFWVGLCCWGGGVLGVGFWGSATGSFLSAPSIFQLPKSPLIPLATFWSTHRPWPSRPHLPVAVLFHGLYFFFPTNLLRIPVRDRPVSSRSSLFKVFPGAVSFWTIALMSKEASLLPRYVPSSGFSSFWECCFSKTSSPSKAFFYG